MTIFESGLNTDIKVITIPQTIFGNWICHYGIMKLVATSDGAPNVNGIVMTTLSQMTDIKKTKSSRLHQQCYDLSEAIVKYLKSVIIKQVDNHGSNWDL